MKKTIPLLYVFLFIFSCASTHRHYSPQSGYYAQRNQNTGVVGKLKIYNADVILESSDPEETHQKIEKILANFPKSYTVLNEENYILLRIKSEQFDQFLKAIEKMDEFEKKKIYMYDKTAEFKDLNIRLKNALAFKKRYESLLQKANRVEEMIKIEKELERITEKIELLKGKINYLKHLAVYSTVRIYIQKKVTPGPLGWIFYGVYHFIKWLFVWD